jgi:hypothetical protein
LECAVNAGTADRCGVWDKNAPPTGSDPALDDAPAARLAACAVNVSRTASVPRISRANIPRDAFLTRVATLWNAATSGGGSQPAVRFDGSECVDAIHGIHETRLWTSALAV